MTPRATVLRRYCEQSDRCLRDHIDEGFRSRLQAGSDAGIRAAIRRAVVEDDRAAAELRQLLGGIARRRGRG